MNSHPHIGNPTHPAYPFSSHSTHRSLSAYDLPSSLANIQGIHRFSMTRVAGSSEDALIRHIAFPNESLKVDLAPLVRGKNWRNITIEMLPEDILLEIFDFYRLDAMRQPRQLPWKWHRLACVCRKWRYAISMSPRRLDLRILCEYGAPIGSILRSWPTLPLVARFNASRKSTIPRNVMVALRRPDRLCQIDLDITSSMTGPIVEMVQKPCQALESIRITVNDTTRPSILVHNPFLGGSAPHLREIKLDGIAFPFPEIRQLLLSTNNLVELHLSSIPNDAYFSPDDLVTGLTTLVQLKRLMVDFHSPASPPLNLTRPPPRRTTLPSLMFLGFHCASEYLEEFVAQIDSPALCEITVGLFNQIFFEIPRFCQFIPRLNALRSPTWVSVTHSMKSVSVLFFQEGNPSNEYCLETSCRRLDWQLSFVTEISSQLSPLLSSVRSISIKRCDGSPDGAGDVDFTQWLELFRPYIHVTQIHVLEERFVPDIVEALRAEGMDAGLLPELTWLRLIGYKKSLSVAEAAMQFVAARGRTVSLYD